MNFLVSALESTKCPIAFHISLFAVTKICYKKVSLQDVIFLRKENLFHNRGETHHSQASCLVFHQHSGSLQRFV